MMGKTYNTSGWSSGKEVAEASRAQSRLSEHYTRSPEIPASSYDHIPHP